MAKVKVLVVHPKLALRAKLEGDSDAKVQNIPKGTELSMEAAHAKSMIASGKLKLVGAKKAADDSDK